MLLVVDPSQNSLGADDEQDRSNRAKRNHYLLFQASSWGLILVVQLVGFATVRLPDLKPDSYPRIHPIQCAIGTFLFPCALGFVITHYTRSLIRYWGWKRLDWNSLIPRIMVSAAAQALLFLILVMTVSGYLLHAPGLHDRSVPRLLVIWLGNSLLFGGWLGAYFFYHLFDRCNRLENERLSLASSQKEAELRALKSQVNPHFIFNALNSLRSLIEEDPARARLAVTQFANLLRHSLQVGQSETVSLDDELRAAQDYLALEQVRYQGRLRLRFDIEPDALAQRVPPMLVQTLVENAIKYGIAQRRQGGEVSISACHEGDTLRIRVTNPGTIERDAKTMFPSMGLGLNNASRRLRLLFGERATVQLRSDEAGLVIAEVVMPLRPNSVPAL